ncbi:MAG: glutamine synthetase [Thermoprotei archaeon ex4572_64]|nr:MAG: glutamine synthetase [Thermoprotei archaeon ex4572_64]
MFNPSKEILKQLSNIDPIDVWRVLKGSGVKYVKFIIVDIHGRPRSQIMLIDAAKDVLVSGMPFDGSSIPFYATVNKSDYVALPDLRSVYIESWNGGKIADIFTNVLEGSDTPSPMDPRNVLMQTYQYVKEKGYIVKISVEIEYFLVREINGKPVPADSGVYFEGFNTQMLLDAITDIVSSLETSGIIISKTHHEVAPSQYEVNIGPFDPVKTGDSVIMFKILAKDVAVRHGLVATFMPKPFWGINGSGAHTHLSTYSIKTGENLFSSMKKITETCGYSIAGILNYAREMSLIVAPLVNSYKRLVPHHEAPTRITWGYSNRSTLIRVPAYKGKIDRIEYRHPDPSFNPYLGFSCIIIAMMEGIEKKITPPDPTEDVAYELSGVKETPAHLGEAIEEFKRSIFAQRLPSELIKRFIQLKEKEWLSYLEAVKKSWSETWNVITDWEYEQYLHYA